MPQVPVLAQNAASRARTSGNLVGFDFGLILTIITTLLPFLKDCFNPPSPGATRKYVKDHYVNGVYQKAVLNRATAQTLKAWRQQGKKVKRKANKAEAQTMAIAVLDEIRLSDDATIQQAMDAT